MSMIIIIHWIGAYKNCLASNPTEASILKYFLPKIYQSRRNTACNTTPTLADKLIDMIPNRAKINLTPPTANITTFLASGGSIKTLSLTNQLTIKADWPLSFVMIVTPKVESPISQSTQTR